MPSEQSTPPPAPTAAGPPAPSETALPTTPPAQPARPQPRPLRPPSHTAGGGGRSTGSPTAAECAAGGSRDVGRGSQEGSRCAESLGPCRWASSGPPGTRRFRGDHVAQSRQRRESSSDDTPFSVFFVGAVCAPSSRSAIRALSATRWRKVSGQVTGRPRVARGKPHRRIGGRPDRQGDAVRRALAGVPADGGVVHGWRLPSNHRRCWEVCVGCQRRGAPTVIPFDRTAIHRSVGLAGMCGSSQLSSGSR